MKFQVDILQSEILAYVSRGVRPSHLVITLRALAGHLQSSFPWLSVLKKKRDTSECFSFQQKNVTDPECFELQLQDVNVTGKALHQRVSLWCRCHLGDTVTINQATW